MRLKRGTLVVFTFGGVRRISSINKVINYSNITLNGDWATFARSEVEIATDQDLFMLSKDQLIQLLQKGYY